MKYRLEDEGGAKRVVAVDGIASIGVWPGDRGGIVDSPDVLSQEGSCWIDEGCTVKGGAVAGSSRVKGGAAVTGCLLLDTVVDGGRYHGCTLAACRITACELTACRFARVELSRYLASGSSRLCNGFGKWVNLVVPACEMAAALGVPDEGPFSEAACDVPLRICGSELRVGPVPAKSLPLVDAMLRGSALRPLRTCDCNGKAMAIAFESLAPGSVAGDDDLRHKSSYAVYSATPAAATAAALGDTPGFAEPFPDGRAIAREAEEAFGVQFSHPGRVSWRRLGLRVRENGEGGLAALARAASGAGWNADLKDGELHIHHPDPSSDNFHADTLRLFAAVRDARMSA